MRTAWVTGLGGKALGSVPCSRPCKSQLLPDSSVAQRLLLVEPLEEAFAKLISADHDGAGGRGLDDPGEEACDGKTDHG